MILWNLLGQIAFWITWPGSRLLLRFTTRTRAFILHGNKVLVVKPWLGNGKWGLPGGGIKASEDALMALVREIKEETGIILHSTECRKVDSREYKSSGLRFVYALYKVRLRKETTIKQQRGEIVAACWMERSLLTKQNANSDVMDALQKS